MRFHLPDSAARAQRRRDDDRGGLVRDCSLAIASGGVLAATAFARHWALQLPAVVAMAAVFWLLRTVPARRAYAVGASFTLAWLVPTTYWYYNFMSLGAAFGASVGWALLMANLFQLTALRKRFGTRLVWSLFSLLWLALTWLRMRMPVTEDWWLPHLGYSVWRNSGLVRLGGFGGEAVLEAVVLAGGMAVAAAGARRGPRAASFSPFPAAGAEEDAEDVVGGVMVHSPGAAPPAVPAGARRDRAPGCGSTGSLRVRLAAPTAGLIRTSQDRGSARGGARFPDAAGVAVRTPGPVRGTRSRSEYPTLPARLRRHAPHGGSPIVVGGQGAASVTLRRRPRRTAFVTRRQTSRILHLSVHAC